MSKQTVYRISLAFSSEQERRDAEDIIRRAGDRGLNRLIKQIIRQWLESQHAQHV